MVKSFDSDACLCTEPFLERREEFDPSSYIVEYSVVDHGCLETLVTGYQSHTVDVFTQGSRPGGLSCTGASVHTEGFTTP